MVASLFVTAGCSSTPSTPPATPPSSGTAVAILPSGESVALELAIDPQSRARGLMGRSEVPRGTGMLFIFDAPAREPFWMYNCLTAIDIVWLDATGTAIYLVESAPPCTGPPDTCPSYQPESDASYVLELGPGEARRGGLLRGARVILNLGEAKPR